MNRQRKQKIRDIQSDDEMSESGPEISDAEDYAEGKIPFWNSKIFNFKD